MLDRLRRIWLFSFLILAIGFGGALLLDQSSTLTIPEIVSHRFLYLALLWHLLYWIVYCRLWQTLVLQASNIPIRFFHSVMQTVMLVLGKYFPGKIWGMVARFAHLNSFGIDRRSALSATFHEQYLVLHSAAVLCGFLASIVMTGWWKPAAAIATIVMILTGEMLQKWGLSLYERLSRSQKQFSSLGYVVPIPRARYLKLLSLYMLSWLLNGAIFASIYFAFFDTPCTTELLALLLLANTVGITAGFLALFAPGGIGVREAVSTSLLIRSMPLADALMLATMFRLWLLVTDLLFGILLLGVMRKHLNSGWHSAPK